MTAGPVLVEARSLTLEYAEGRRTVRAVDGLDLEVRRGEFLGVQGPSGSGKSSLLFLLAGLRRPTAGEVRFEGAPLPRDAAVAARLRRRRMGMVFQDAFLVPYLSVRENALVHATGVADEERLARHAAPLGMEGLLEERPHRLSGGERQRAGVLRALVHGPDLVLADEPTAHLDHPSGRAVMAALRAAGEGCALVVVTHDAEMLADADRVLALRDGRLA